MRFRFCFADPAAARQATENLAAQAKASLKGLTIEEARTVLNLKDLKEGIDATEVKEVFIFAVIVTDQRPCIWPALVILILATSRTELLDPHVRG